MDKPSDIAFRLCDLGVIHGLHIEQRQTGTDTADTFVKITGSNGKAEGLWKTVKEFLELRPGHDSVCHVLDRHVDAVNDWRAFEKRNAKELAEYRRLREKFGDS